MKFDTIASWAAPIVISALIGAGGAYATLGSQAATISDQEVRLRTVETTGARVDERLKSIESTLQEIKGLIATKR